MASAFEINRKAGGGRWFPLGFTLSPERDGIVTASLHAQSVREAADVLTAHVQQAVLLFDVSHHVYSGEARQPTLAMIAAEACVDAIPLDPNVIQIAAAMLPTLIEHLPHYELSLLDCSEQTDAASAFRAVLAAASTEWTRGELVLSRVPESRVFLASHDDCYLYLESRSRSHLLDHLGLLLQNYVAALIGSVDVHVSRPSDELMESLLRASGSITILDSNASVRDAWIGLGYSHDRYHSSATDPAPTAHLAYDLAQRAWSIG